MIFNLPNKINEINLFKKENKSCTLYSYSPRNLITIVAELPDFEIPHHFYVDDKAINMLILLAPINDIKIDDNFMTIKGVKGNYKARFIQEDIVLPELDLENKITLDIARIKIANKFVAVSKEQRAILTGVNVNSNGDLYATDSYMAYRYKSGLESDYEANITIPKTFIDFINPLFNDQVDIYFNTNSCYVKKDNVYYISRLINGKYPNVERIFNSVVQTNTITFNIEDLNEKLNIISTLDCTAVNFKNNIIKASSGELYDINIDVKYDNDYEFNVSLAKLKQILSNIKDNEFILNFEGALKQLYVKDNDNEFILLPMRM